LQLLLLRVERLGRRLALAAAAVIARGLALAPVAAALAVGRGLALAGGLAVGRLLALALAAVLALLLLLLLLLLLGLLLALLLALLGLLGLLAAVAAALAAVGEHGLGLLVVVGGHRRVAGGAGLVAQPLQRERVVGPHVALVLAGRLALRRPRHEVERDLELLGGLEELAARVDRGALVEVRLPGLDDVEHLERLGPLGGGVVVRVLVRRGPRHVERDGREQLERRQERDQHQRRGPQQQPAATCRELLGEACVA